MPNPADDVLAGAKDTLAKAESAFPSTPAFAPKAMPSHIDHIKAAAPAHEFSNAPYSMASEAKSTSDGLKANKANVDQYKAAE